MNTVFALIVAGVLVTGEPVAGIVDLFKTEKECVVAKKEVTPTDSALYFGVSCVKIEKNKGKAV